ncbi:hypothetical protein VCRA2110O2_30276 [Vibrio crassostreae]|nr:hypothetical protein VCHA44O286_50099 [Vibrio chagasii]CAK2868609.1 hypothetical protein VCRA2110O2_30276 [Vibrio crassostreae]
MSGLIFESLEPVLHAIVRGVWFVFRWFFIDLIFWLGELLLGSLFKSSGEKKTASSYVAGLVIFTAVIGIGYYLLNLIPSEPPAL